MESKNDFDMVNISVVILKIVILVNIVSFVCWCGGLIVMLNVIIVVLIVGVVCKNL